MLHPGIGYELVLPTSFPSANLISSASLDDIIVDDRVLTYNKIDLSDFNKCLWLTENIDYVFHIAGIKGSVKVTKSNPASFFVPLLMMNTNVLEACRINNVEKVVYTSSIGAYSSAEVFKENENLDGEPMDMFPGWSKRMAEKQIEAYKIQYGLKNFSIVRICNCFSFDTNVLTLSGIKNIKEIEIGDKVYTINPNNFEIEIGKVINTVESEENESVLINHSYGVDWEITKDHNLFINTNKSNFKFVKAGLILKKNKTQRSLALHKPFSFNKNNYSIFDMLKYADDNHYLCIFPKKGDKIDHKNIRKFGLIKHNGNRIYYAKKKKEIKYYKEFVKKYNKRIYIKDYICRSHFVYSKLPMLPFMSLLGWFISEGHISETSKKSFQVVISQYKKNKENREKIEKSIKKCGFCCGHGEKYLSFSSRLFYNFIKTYMKKYAKNKKIPSFVFSLSFVCLNEIFDSLMRGDGDKTFRRYSTCSDELAKDFFHLSFLLGHQPLLRKKYVRGKKIYRIYMREKNLRRTFKDNHVSIKEYDKKKKFYCITTNKNHIIYAGRNGFMGWIGQCFGPGDNFDPENAMVIPTLMQRIYNRENPVKIWGDGSAIRDFAYSKDIAEGIIQALYYGTDGKFVNLGSGAGVSIKELVETLRSFLNFNYEFDISKPSGFPKRVMDISLAKAKINYNPTTSLYDGLKETWEWFVENHDEYLKKKNYFKKEENDS